MHAVDGCFYDISSCVSYSYLHMLQKQLSSHTKVGATGGVGGGGGGGGGGVSNLIDMILLYDFHQSSLDSINLRDLILSYDPSIDNSTTIFLLTVINGTLIKDIGKKDIGAFCCYSLVITNCTCSIKIYRRFASCSLAHFKYRLMFPLFS